LSLPGEHDWIWIAGLLKSAGSNKVLDTLKKEYRRTNIAHRRQHKTQRGMGVLVVVDVYDFCVPPKTRHQSSELIPVAEAVDLESH